MPDFIPGLELNHAFYWEAVRPILDAHYPGLPHAAGLVGYGSDVLGYDTPTSRDHMWGPRLMLFLAPEGFESAKSAIYETLRQHLPVTFRGYSTHFGRPDLTDNGTRVRAEVETGPVDPLIYFHTVDSFLRDELGVGAEQPLRAVDWLSFQEMRLLTVTGGRVYHDGLGLEAARRRFAYYPEPVWRAVLAAQWGLIGQEEAFVGRTHAVGDELGSRVVAARLAERLMRLCFLMEKTYAPYSKWFGTAFKRLKSAERMGPLLESALAAGDYAGREQGLAAAYRLAVELHNQLGITAPVEAVTRTYSGWHHYRVTGQEIPPGDPADTRPHQVIFADRVAGPIWDGIEDPEVRALRPLFGSVNQFLVESSPAVQSVPFCRAISEKLTGSSA